MNRLRILLRVFLASWLLNLIWENLHVFLYEQYRGVFYSQMGQFDKFQILLKASIFDAVFITVVVFLIMLIPWLKGKESWSLIVIAVLFSISLELYALDTGRWAYNSLMPLIPILDIGVSPVIQLGLIGYLVTRFTFAKS
jgi:hypothetical protein